MPTQLKLAKSVVSVSSWPVLFLKRFLEQAFKSWPGIVVSLPCTVALNGTVPIQTVNLEYNIVCSR